MVSIYLLILCFHNVVPLFVGDVRTQSLSLLRILVETAVKINAIEFFRIVFSTHVGRSVFKSFKDEQLLLEEIARRNGHEELACLLEQKHLMYVECFTCNRKGRSINLNMARNGPSTLRMLCPVMHLS